MEKEFNEKAKALSEPDIEEFASKMEKVKQESHKVDGENVKESKPEP